MQYSFVKACLLALASTTAVLAQTAGFDVITAPARNEVIAAGSTFTITWTSSDPAGKISLVLLEGASNTTLQIGDTIASALDSTTGSYAWAVPSTLTAYKVYGIKLQLDSDTTTFQYSNPFYITGLSSSTSATVSPTATVTAHISQVSTYTTSHNSTTSHSSTLSTSVVYSNRTTTTAPKSTTTAIVVTTAHATTTTAAITSSSTAGAAATLVAGSGAGVLAIAVALFL